MSIGIFSNSGNDVKLLKDQLDLNGTAKVLTGTSDPRSSAKDAPQGSLYLQTGATGGKLFKKLDAGSSTNWTEVGSGAGGINYILNPDGEAGTTGWAAYADAPGTTPVDGTGGSANVTFTTSTSSPLRGLSSFLFTKDAANRQGQGVAYAFTLDSADKNQVLQISFDYAVSSGTFVPGASSDVRVFIYDVTNSTLIYPLDFKLYSNTQDSFQATFQASTSTSYRLILHVATTSASAYVLKLDNIKVGPSTRLQATPMTDWTDVSSLVSIPAAYGTVSELEYWERRVGDTAFYRGKFKFGTPAASPATLPLRPGLSVDTGKFTSNATAGFEACHYVGTATTLLTAQQSFTSADIHFEVFFDETTGLLYVSNNVKDTEFLVRNGNDFANSGDVFTFEFSVPITGWSSQVLMSDQADTRVTAARYTSMAAQSIPTATVTIVDFDDMDFDTHGLVTTGANWKFTATQQGYYRASARVNYSTLGTTNNYNLYLYKNGSSVARFYGGGDGTLQGTETVFLLPGDYIDFRTDQDTAGSVALAGAVDSVGVSIERVSGPSAIAANELVAAVYTRTTTQSIPNGTDTIVDFDVKQVDTHGAVTTGASWKFTVPVAGTYSISVSVGFATNTTGARYALIRKNGSFSARGGDSKMGVTGVDTMMNFTVLERLVPGDYIDVNVLQSSGGALNTSSTLTFPAISIHRVGF
jgi:hypothetical protein